MEKQLRGVLECSQEHLYLNQEQAQTLPWLVNVPLISGSTVLYQT